MNNDSIFGALGAQIARSMSLSIYNTSRINNIGHLNISDGNVQQKQPGRNTDIICGHFVCDEDNNDFFCK